MNDDERTVELDAAFDELGVAFKGLEVVLDEFGYFCSGPRVDLCSR